MRKLFGWIAFGCGCWMLISPQARIGLNEIRWMDRYVFSGEVLLAVFVVAIAYYLLDFNPTRVHSAIIRDSKREEHEHSFHSAR